MKASVSSYSPVKYQLQGSSQYSDETFRAAFQKHSLSVSREISENRASAIGGYEQPCAPEHKCFNSTERVRFLDSQLSKRESRTDETRYMNDKGEPASCFYNNSRQGSSVAIFVSSSQCASRAVMRDPRRPTPLAYCRQRREVRQKTCYERLCLDCFGKLAREICKHRSRKWR